MLLRYLVILHFPAYHTWRSFIWGQCAEKNEIHFHMKKYKCIVLFFLDNFCAIICVFVFYETSAICLTSMFTWQTNAATRSPIRDNELTSTANPKLEPEFPSINPGGKIFSFRLSRLLLVLYVVICCTALISGINWFH